MAINVHTSFEVKFVIGKYNANSFDTYVVRWIRRVSSNLHVFLCMFRLNPSTPYTNWCDTSHECYAHCTLEFDRSNEAYTMISARSRFIRFRTKYIPVVLSDKCKHVRMTGIDASIKYIANTRRAHFKTNTIRNFLWYRNGVLGAFTFNDSEKQTKGNVELKSIWCELKMGRSTSDKCELIPFDRENWRKCSTTVNKREGKNDFEPEEANFLWKYGFFFHFPFMRRTEIRRMVSIRFDMKLREEGEREKKLFHYYCLPTFVCLCIDSYYCAFLFEIKITEKKNSRFSSFRAILMIEYDKRQRNRGQHWNEKQKNQN